MRVTPMYEGTPDEVVLPVHLNSKFILGPEGAHLNISGISGLAAKSLVCDVPDEGNPGTVSSANTDETAAFVIFNVKGEI